MPEMRKATRWRLSNQRSAGELQTAAEKISHAEEALVKAHHAQTGLLTKEAQGDHMDITLLAVHGQDHLMTSIAFVDLSKEIIDLYKRN